MHCEYRLWKWNKKKCNKNHSGYFSFHYIWTYLKVSGMEQNHVHLFWFNRLQSGLTILPAVGLLKKTFRRELFLHRCRGVWGRRWQRAEIDRHSLSPMPLGHTFTFCWVDVKLRAGPLLWMEYDFLLSSPKNTAQWCLLCWTCKLDLYSNSKSPLKGSRITLQVYNVWFQITIQSYR